jgi:hypothetical protein
MAGHEAGADETARPNRTVWPTACGCGVSSTRRAGKSAAGSGVVDFVAIWPTESGFARSLGRLAAHLPVLPTKSKVCFIALFRRIVCTNLLLSPFTFNYHSIFGTPDLRTIRKGGMYRKREDSQIDAVLGIEKCVLGSKNDNYYLGTKFECYTDN